MKNSNTDAALNIMRKIDQLTRFREKFEFTKHKNENFYIALINTELLKHQLAFTCKVNVKEVEYQQEIRRFSGWINQLVAKGQNTIFPHPTSFDKKIHIKDVQTKLLYTDTASFLDIDGLTYKRKNPTSLLALIFSIMKKNHPSLAPLIKRIKSNLIMPQLKSSVVASAAI